MTKHRLIPTLRFTHVARVLAGVSIAIAGGTIAASPALAEPPNSSALKPTSSEIVRPTLSRLQIEAEQLPKVSAQQVLSIAEKQIGIRENARGGGTKFQSWYESSPRGRETVARDGGSVQDYANAPWCAMFVSWVGEQAGIRPAMGWDAYTVTYAKWFKDNHRWGNVAEPGAVVFYDWNGSKDIDGIDHVGLVKKDNGNGTITTIEGNTGNGVVEQRIRPKSQVVGYGYPLYTA
ncbi:CHAP domain-containing protein [Streptosporangium lutulentum]|uniref:Peptidase C51 domain-containing protein n=1 Tax=Streptosporangium lutulentum TaxID=1461250 RepID=A0ABT9Q5G9_9ACTN|nr:CHAP domain-containing protein [Streptosporangium lutulentum]MDP9841912.1 hypothetical protein [Streptosporangium lutulentum]